jgi:signal recognition particle subunit SRP54
MFNSLGDRLSKTLEKLRGTKKLNEKNITSTLKEIKKTLIEADVALQVVKNFTKDIEKKAIGQNITKKTKANETLIKFVNDQLIKTLGEKTEPLNIKSSETSIILMAGLQGSGKTTTTAKLALLLKEHEKKRVLVTSADIYRPAAIEQLKTLAEQIEIDFFPSSTNEKPIDIAKKAIKHAKLHQHDILIIDTAGRNHVDKDLMKEINSLSKAISPQETLLVVDSMAGQDAANVAREFNQNLEITGIVLTKTDGDSRGGAALSMRMITEKPIKLIGTGEKVDALEKFHPNRIASRILGKGDIVSLVEEAERKIDKKELEAISKKIKKGNTFNLNDFSKQLQQMSKMGGIESMLKKIPGAQQIQQNKEMMNDDSIKSMQTILSSMTKNEKLYPALLNTSRKKRIANGSGKSPQEISKLLKKFEKMKKTLKRMSGTKMKKRLEQMRGQIPPELMNEMEST